MARGREGRIFVGNLPYEFTKDDVEDMFSKFGKIIACDVRTKEDYRPFAFVEYDDPRDADDAIHDRDGVEVRGTRIRVEQSRSRESYRDGPERSGRGHRSDRHPGDRRQITHIKGKYRVYVSGLPPTGSWQDLKDHMREAGDVAFADTYRDGTGMVAYYRYDDYKYALKKLHDTKFRSHEGEITVISVSGETSRGGSPSGERGRSRSRSPRRSPRRRTPSYGRRSPSYSRRSPSYGRRASPTYSPVRRADSPRPSVSPRYSRSRSRDY